MQAVISALRKVDTDARRRIFDAAATFLQISPASPTSSRRPSEPSASASASPDTAYPAFSADTDMSPKEFLFQKQPRTDVERLAVLAFYLAHYRATPQFKTLDLSKLNTEAAQPKFANAAASANNAVKQGYLASATKGQRQLSAAGERFVAALPDREAAREALARARPKQKTRKASPVKRAPNRS